MKNWKKVMSVFGIMMWLIGTIGGAGYCGWIGEWVVAVAVIVLGVMAFPTVKQLYYNIIVS